MPLFTLFTQLVPLPSTLWPNSGADVYKLCQFAFLSTPLLLPVLRFIQAPHGRFSFESKLNVPGNLSWFLMEVVSPITFTVALMSKPLASQPLDGIIGVSDLFSPSLNRLLQLPVANKILASMFVLHYINRSIINPLRSPARSSMHLSVPLSAVFFNLINGFLMGSWIGGRSPATLLPALAFIPEKTSLLGKVFSGLRGTPASLTVRTIESPGLLPENFSLVASNPLFIIGVLGWAVGFASNVYHDEILLDVRRPPEKRVTRAMAEDEEDKSSGPPKDGKPKYGIPKGGLYKYISYPNYLSEWFEWLSYSLAALSLTPMSSYSPTAPILPLTSEARAILLLTSPPLLFLLAEFCPMFPRALSGHQWYHSKFGVQGDGKGGKYPRDRKAVIPFVL